MCDLLIVANPCFGLDLKRWPRSARGSWRRAIAGAAVLLVSEDLDEILELADRIVVMHGGAVVHETPARARMRSRSARHMLGSH